MKLRHSVLCFLLIVGCAGILLSRLEPGTAAVSAVAGTDESGTAGTGAGKDTEQPDGAKNSLTIVVDAGHGGIDPGKIGVNDAKEKDINLAIALLLKQYFSSQGITVIMTRETDTGLYSEGAAGKKSEDMRNRVALIEENQADILVSIHQNSFTQSQYHGAQVFYYSSSSESKILAETVQQQLIAGADPENTRQAKANSDYYLLKKSPSTAIICECGFLSNPDECEKLCTPEYQRKIAWNIYLGVMQYLNSQSNMVK